MTKAPPVIVADFETHQILPRPNYPPKPVSLALKWPDTREYELMAWGHGDGSKAAGNNCTEQHARSRYAAARASKYQEQLTGDDGWCCNDCYMTPEEWNEA